MAEQSVHPSTSAVPRGVRHCNTCGALIDASGGQRAYHLVPAGQAERAAAGGHVPWAIWLCAACYQREHP